MHDKESTIRYEKERQNLDEKIQQMKMEFVKKSALKERGSTESHRFVKSNSKEANFDEDDFEKDLFRLGSESQLSNNMFKTLESTKKE